MSASAGGVHEAAVTAERLTVPSASRGLIAWLQSVMRPGAVLEALRRDWRYPRELGLEIEDCQLIRLIPRGDHGFVLEYELGLRDADRRSSQRLFAEMILGDPRRSFEEVTLSLRKSRRKQLSPKTPAGAVDYLAGLGLLVRLPGFDERLPGLKLLHKPKLLPPVLSRHVLGEGKRADKVKSAILGQRLGKRCTARLEFSVSENGSADRSPASVIVKLYKSRTPIGLHAAAAMHRLVDHGFGATSRLRIPAPLAFLNEWQIQFMEDVAGSGLCELRGTDYRNGVALAGEMLAKLHRSPMTVANHHSVDDELLLVHRWTELVARVDNGLGTAVDLAYRRVRDLLETCRGAPGALCHRDFYDGQILVDGRRAVVVDFDTLCHADPAIDAGNFIAHLRRARACGECSVEGAEDAFLEGYGRVAASSMNPRLEAYSKSSLLRLACLASFGPRAGVAEALLEQID